MFNVTGGEVVIILILALVVLGPDKLPEAIRKFGQFYGEFKKMSTGFQSEMRNALDEPLRELRGTADLAKGIFDQPAEELKKTTDALRGAINSTMNPQPATPDPSPGVAAALAARQAEEAAAAASAAAAATALAANPPLELPDHSLRTIDMSTSDDTPTADAASDTPTSDTPSGEAPNVTFGHTLAAIMREHDAPGRPDGMAATDDPLAPALASEATVDGATANGAASTNGDAASSTSAAPDTSIDIADKYALDILELPGEEPAQVEPNLYSTPALTLREQYIIAKAGQTVSEDGANAE